VYNIINQRIDPHLLNLPRQESGEKFDEDIYGDGSAPGYLHPKVALDQESDAEIAARLYEEFCN